MVRRQWRATITCKKYLNGKTLRVELGGDISNEMHKSKVAHMLLEIGRMFETSTEIDKWIDTLKLEILPPNGKLTP